MKMCINWRVVGGLSLVGLAVFALAPNLIGAALPLLVVAACPLSMLLMMRAMQGGGRCDSSSDTTTGESQSQRADSAAELAQLRAELDQLRAERAVTTRAEGTRPAAKG